MNMSIYEKTIERDCKRITMEEFTPILDEVREKELSNVEEHILEHYFILGETSSTIRYQLGDRTTSRVHSKIRKVVDLMRSYVNFKYCEEDDLLSLFAGKELLKHAKIKDSTIREAIAIYSNPKYVYLNKHDEAIAYYILKRFSYRANLLKMHTLKELEWDVCLYNKLYPNGTADYEDNEKGECYEYLFVKNVYDAIYKNRLPINPMYLYLITVKQIGEDRGLNTLRSVLVNDQFKKLIYDPECYHTDKYFDGKTIKEIGIEYLTLSMTKIGYDTIKSYLLNDIENPSLYDLIYRVLCTDPKPDASAADAAIMEGLSVLIGSICKVNSCIVYGVDVIRKNIQEAKDLISK